MRTSSALVNSAKRLVIAAGLALTFSGVAFAQPDERPMRRGPAMESREQGGRGQGDRRRDQQAGPDRDDRPRNAAPRGDDNGPRRRAMNDPRPDQDVRGMDRGPKSQRGPGQRGNPDQFRDRDTDRPGQAIAPRDRRGPGNPDAMNRGPGPRNDPQFSQRGRPRGQAQDNRPMRGRAGPDNRQGPGPGMGPERGPAMKNRDGRGPDMDRPIPRPRGQRDGPSAAELRGRAGTDNVGPGRGRANGRPNDRQNDRPGVMQGGGQGRGRGQGQAQGQGPGRHQDQSQGQSQRRGPDTRKPALDRPIRPIRPDDASSSIDRGTPRADQERRRSGRENPDSNAGPGPRGTGPQTGDPAGDQRRRRGDRSDQPDGQGSPAQPPSDL